jgi:hypothetical protein
MANEQEGPEAQPDFVDVAQKLRNREQWLRYDSVQIGPGARGEDPGWYDSWAQFAQAEQVELFSGARQGVNKAWSNSSEREDYAQLIYGMYAEFTAPVCDLRQLTNPLDQDLARWWTSEIPRGTYLTVQLQDTDNILRIPATYAPAGHGPTEVRTDGAAAPTLNPGNSGAAQWRECWQWPIPIGVPAVKRVQCTLKFDRRIFQRLQFITNAPGFTVWTAINPLDPQQTLVIPIQNRFSVRVGFLGPRYVQLRGAASQGAT